MDNHLMKLKPCPWCKKTPGVWFPMYDPTWKWIIHCVSFECKMKPSSPHVSIRNTTKKDKDKLKKKIDELAFIWNDQNSYEAYEGRLIDLDKVINEKQS